MSRPQLDRETDIYLEALCAMTGESKHGAINRAVKYAYKNAICKPQFRHYEAITKERLSKELNAVRS